MIRSFIVALVTTVIVAAAGPLGGIAAQPINSTFESYPLDFAGGTPGVSVEIFLNAGKVGDTTINSTGGGNWLLEMGNSGKTRVQIYVDVCKDGKIVKVLFVTAGGQPPPKDEDCDRRLVAAGFQSDCGVTRITIDLGNLGANVMGCGFAIDPKILGIAGGGVAVALLTTLGDGNDTTTSSVSQTPTPPAQSPTNTQPAQPPVTSPPPVTTPPVVVVPLANGQFLIVLVVHPQGANTSLICGVIGHNPLTAGVNFTLIGAGPGVLSQALTGRFNSNGQAGFSISISQTGQYTLTLTITMPDGRTSTVSTAVNVTGSGASQCPSVPTA